ncbi:hypothetical protein [Streptosporangium sp. KLBMP 9127]|nr:hypothetical protein [Streptosporangium sp. KLBMP 9127]
MTHHRKPLNGEGSSTPQATPRNAPAPMCAPWCTSTHTGERLDELTHHSQNAPIPLTLGPRPAALSADLEQYDGKAPQIVLIEGEARPKGAPVLEWERTITLAEAAQIARALDRLVVDGATRPAAEGCRAWCAEHDGDGGVCHASLPAPAGNGQVGLTYCTEDPGDGFRVYLDRWDGLRLAEAEQLARVLDQLVAKAAISSLCPPWCVVEHDEVNVEHVGAATVLGDDINVVDEDVFLPEVLGQLREQPGDTIRYAVTCTAPGGAVELGLPAAEKLAWSILREVMVARHMAGDLT